MPRKQSIEKQIQAVISQAVQEGRHNLAKQLINILEQSGQAQQEPAKTPLRGSGNAC